jgi:hypothetical protein
MGGPFGTEGHIPYSLMARRRPVLISAVARREKKFDLQRRVEEAGRER